MAFTLFINGPRVGALAETAPDLVEELSNRGVAAQILSTEPVDEEMVKVLQAEALPAHLSGLAERDISAVVFCCELARAAREAIIARAPDPVVVDWCRLDEVTFERSEGAHCDLTDEEQVLDGFAEIFAVLEGLGYVPFADRGALTPEQDAELVEKLKELGYV
jgi:hypothetical protein